MPIHAAPLSKQHARLCSSVTAERFLLRGAFMRILLCCAEFFSWSASRTGAWKPAVRPRMVKRGLKKTDFQPGTDVIVSGYLAQDGQLKVAGTSRSPIERPSAVNRRSRLDDRRPRGLFAAAVGQQQHRNSRREYRQRSPETQLSRRLRKATLDGNYRVARQR